MKALKHFIAALAVFASFSGHAADVTLDANTTEKVGIYKTTTGTAVVTGEDASPLMVLYSPSANSGAYTSQGHVFNGRTNVGFAGTFRGTTHGVSSLTDIGAVDGSGDSEIAGFYGFINSFDATGKNNLSQQGMDLSVKGPTATLSNRPNLLTGHSLALNNMSPMGAISGSKRGAIGFMMAAVPGQSIQEASWTGKTTYPWNAGFWAAGWSGPYNTATDGIAATATAGYDKAFRAGGAAGGVMLGTWRSKINEAFYAEDYTTTAFHATNPHPTFAGAAFLADQGAGFYSYGIAAPEAPLHIGVDGTANAIVQSATQNASLKLRRSQGSIASKTDVSAGQIGSILFEGYKNSDWRNAASITSDIQAVGTNYVNGNVKVNASYNGTSSTIAEFLPDGLRVGGTSTGVAAANTIHIAGAIAGASPFIWAKGPDSRIDINYVMHGNGSFNLFGYDAATVIANINSVTSATSSLQLSNGVGVASVGTSLGDLNLTPAGGLKINGTAGVSCSGTPTASFAVTNGIVTHC